MTYLANQQRGAVRRVREIATTVEIKLQRAAEYERVARVGTASLVQALRSECADRAAHAELIARNAYRLPGAVQ